MPSRTSPFISSSENSFSDLAPSRPYALTSVGAGFVGGVGVWGVGGVWGVCVLGLGVFGGEFGCLGADSGGSCLGGEFGVFGGPKASAGPEREKDP